MSAVFIVAYLGLSHLGIYKSEQPTNFEGLHVTSIDDLTLPNNAWSRKLTVKDASDIQAEISTPQPALGLSADELDKNFGEAISVSEFEMDSYLNSPERLIGEAISDEDNFYLVNADKKQLNVGEFLNPDDLEMLSPKTGSADARHIGLFIDVNSLEVERELNRPQSIGAAMLMDSSL